MEARAEVRCLFTSGVVLHRRFVGRSLTFPRPLRRPLPLPSPPPAPLSAGVDEVSADGRRQPEHPALAEPALVRGGGPPPGAER